MHNHTLIVHDHASRVSNAEVSVMAGGAPKVLVLDLFAGGVRYEPHIPIARRYPQGIAQMVLSADDEWGYKWCQELACCGMSDEAVLSAYEQHHGAAVAWVYRQLVEHADEAVTGASDELLQLLALSAARQDYRLYGIANASHAMMRVVRTAVWQRQWIISASPSALSTAWQALLARTILSAELGTCLPDAAPLQAIARLSAVSEVSEVSELVLVSESVKHRAAAQRFGWQAVSWLGALSLFQ